MFGTIHCTLRRNKSDQLEMFKVMAAPLLTYGRKTWALRKHNAQRIQVAGMKVLRRVKGYSFRDQIKKMGRVGDIQYKR